eukprot:TRINITY_DN5870_c0_g1_i1.p1 TRINITY_DN5870_c0_g1~~TRINITY_DN5870_c0_g1_i1.p1  ORF type:complete len:789 (+),score=202.69 TRINITY_DN5870_c0_g1_i1:299-2665(+)
MSEPSSSAPFGYEHEEVPRAGSRGHGSHETRVDSIFVEGRGELGGVRSTSAPPVEPRIGFRPGADSSEEFLMGGFTLPDHSRVGGVDPAGLPGSQQSPVSYSLGGIRFTFGGDVLEDTTHAPGPGDSGLPSTSSGAYTSLPIARPTPIAKNGLPYRTGTIPSYGGEYRDSEFPRGDVTLDDIGGHTSSDVFGPRASPPSYGAPGASTLFDSPPFGFSRGVGLRPGGSDLEGVDMRGQPPTHHPHMHSHPHPQHSHSHPHPSHHAPSEPTGPLPDDRRPTPPYGTQGIPLDDKTASLASALQGLRFESPPPPGAHDGFGATHHPQMMDHPSTHGAYFHDGYHPSYLYRTSSQPTHSTVMQSPPPGYGGTYGQHVVFVSPTDAAMHGGRGMGHPRSMDPHYVYTSTMAGGRRPGYHLDEYAGHRSMSAQYGVRFPRRKEEAYVYAGRRDPLLEECRNKKRKLELVEIQGRVMDFARDQFGSRFIQQKLESATDEEKEMVFLEIQDKCLELMTDVFGNYVVQKLLEHGLAHHREHLVSSLKGHVFHLTTQMYGCRVIQKSLEVVDRDSQVAIIEELRGHVVQCVQDQNGNHVIQKCIEMVPAPAVSFIVNDFVGNVVAFSRHAYGCRVVQRILEHGNGEQKRTMLTEILPNTILLAQDQYGNYVVQHVLEHGSPDDRTHIVDTVTERIVECATHKFSSNVVEKCFEFGSESDRSRMLDVLLRGVGEQMVIFPMLHDQYANYVVQKFLDLAKTPMYDRMVKSIRPLLPLLRKYSAYGKHIVARMERPERERR